MRTFKPLFVLATCAAALTVSATSAPAFKLTPQHRITSRHERPRSSDVAMDARGRAYAAWSSHSAPRDDRGTVAHFSRLDRRGRPARVIDLGSAKRVFVQVATAPDGTSTVVYPNRRGGRPHVEMVQIDPDGHRGPIRTLSLAGQPVDPFSIHAEAAPDGSVFVSWASPGVRVVRIAPDSTLGPLQRVSEKPLTTDSYDDGPDLSVNGRGEAALAWTESGELIPEQAQRSVTVQFARVSALGIAGEPQTAVDDDGSLKGGPPLVALADDGTANIAYTASYSGLPYPAITASVNFFVRVSPEGEIAAPAVLTNSYFSPLVEMTMDETGRATVALVDQIPGKRSSTARPATTSISPDGQIGPTVDLAARMSGDGVPAFYLASDGRDTFASWTTHRPGDGRHTTVHLASLTPAGHVRSQQQIGPGYAAGLGASGRGPAALTQRFNAKTDPLLSVVPVRRHRHRTPLAR